MFSINFGTVTPGRLSRLGDCHAWGTVTLPDNSTPPQQEQQEDPLQVVQAPGMTIWTF